MKKVLISIITLLLILSGCSFNKLTLYKDVSFDVGFNTPFSLMLYTKNQDEFNEYFELMKKEVRYMNSLFDIYNDYEGINGIKTINDNAGVKPVKVDQLVIDLLLEARELSEATNYYFDPTMGAVLKIWHAAREEGMALNRENKPGKSPDIETLKKAKKYVGWQYVEIDENAQTVYLNNENAALDVGAIAKGWAVEKVAQTLESKGIKHGIVNGGGNVRLIGAKATNEAWSVGVSNPDDINDSSVLSIVFAQSMSVVTSGDYERYFIDEDGNHQHHLVSPETLFPTNISRSVTITTLDSGLADVLSTAFSMVDLKGAKELYKQLDLEDLGLVFVFDEKQANDEGFYYIENLNKHIYYNEQIKNHSK